MIPGLTPGEFKELPLAARIYCAAARFLGWRYSLTAPRVPYAVGSFPMSLVDPGARVTNCSTMSTAIIMSVYDREWKKYDYADFQVFAESLVAHPMGDSPIVAAERNDLGQSVSSFDEDHWHLVQYWNKTNSDGTVNSSGGGHALIVYYDGNDCWTIEASGTRGGGVGAKMSAKKLEYYTSKKKLHLLRLWP